MPTNPAETVGFEILLRAPGSGARPHVATIAKHRPEAEDVERCRRWLAARGVTCHPTGFGLACSAPRERFEILFAVSLKSNVPAEPGRPRFQIVGEIQPPTEIADLIEQVSVSAPPEYF